MTRRQAPSHLDEFARDADVVDVFVERSRHVGIHVGEDAARLVQHVRFLGRRVQRAA